MQQFISSLFLSAVNIKIIYNYAIKCTTQCRFRQTHDDNNDNPVSNKDFKGPIPDFFLLIACLHCVEISSTGSKCIG